MPLVADEFVHRPAVRGKFLFVGEEKYWIKGVTYGTFKPDEAGDQYPAPAVVERDFALMAENGINTVRTYTPPPRWLLDTAGRHGLRVMVGLAWEQHVTFLDDRKLRRNIMERVRAGVRACAGHPALLCFSIGNEIPPSIVRWHGRRRIERFLQYLYRVVKAEDPGVLVTYVNYPTTEYLQLSFLDLICFNVYLEEPEKLEAYLARLQNIAGERPLLMAEIGLDSRRNGDDVQATSLNWQIRTAFAAGCAGAFVYAWTDEWFRGGHDIEDWDFGLTTRTREPKLALGVVRKAFAEVPFSPITQWPKISVVVCSYNGANTIRDTFEGLARLEYANYEVIVINDGSTDDTPSIASEYDVKLISTENRGLSNARNTGWQEASGEMIAYIDDDAYPDPHWLHYIAWTFMHTDYVGVGGPNIAPPGDGPIADCVANAPGGPVQVLISDTEAEHIPGCNMVFRRSALKAIDGFDPRYRAAGDDVDLCWRLMDQGWKIGFNGAAVVWHHRRNSWQMYWKQQIGYGKAEALLEEKWPEKYNVPGHLSWSGRLYGKGLTKTAGFGRWRIYQGQWGTALFQSLYQPAAGTLLSLPLMPEWYLVIGALLLLSAIGLLWSPLLLIAAPLLLLAMAAPCIQATRSALQAEFTSRPQSVMNQLKLRAWTAAMHLMQPMARLVGRLRHGLSPWRLRGKTGWKFPWNRSATLWSEQWHSVEERLTTLAQELGNDRAIVIAGGDYDDWDLNIRGGLFGSVCALMAIEEHGGGKQLIRLNVRPKISRIAVVIIATFILLTLAAIYDDALIAAGILGVILIFFILRLLFECAVATYTGLNAFSRGNSGAE